MNLILKQITLFEFKIEIYFYYIFFLLFIYFFFN